MGGSFMRTNIVAAAAALVILGGIGAATVAADAGTAPATTAGKTVTITMRATQTSQTFVPVPGQKAGGNMQPGDRQISTQRLTVGGKYYGYNQVQCTFMVKRLSCLVAFVLPAGQITVAGAIPRDPQGSFTLAVTGGTGRYRNVSGQLTITLRPQSGSGTETFALRL